jgi:hypothetical protein
MRAPAIVEKRGKYFLFFSANDVHPGETGGIGGSRCKQSSQAFKDYLGSLCVSIKMATLISASTIVGFWQ